ncbi:class F sortase [Candidatus Saccharibacteria bacterium]|nr:class F sortase [Candidatus Saccharibacteria bacterium]
MADLVLKKTDYPAPYTDYFNNNRNKKSKKLRQPKQLPPQLNFIQTRHTVSRKISPIAILRVALISAVLVIAGFLAFDTWTVNNNNRIVEPVSAISESGAGTQNNSIVADVVDSDQGVVATTANAVGRIKIPSIGVDARILSAGLDNQGNIAAPATNYDTAWFSNSSQPGENGAAFISGHVGVGEPGVFESLSQLKHGDTIVIEWVGGVSLTYVVREIKTAPLYELDMREALSVYPGYAKGLNIMTCAGTYDRQAGTYDHRTTIFAVME